MTILAGRPGGGSRACASASSSAGCPGGRAPSGRRPRAGAPGRGGAAGRRRRRRASARRAPRVEARRASGVGRSAAERRRAAAGTASSPRRRRASSSARRLRSSSWRRRSSSSRLRASAASRSRRSRASRSARRRASSSWRRRSSSSRRLASEGAEAGVALRIAQGAQNHAGRGARRRGRRGGARRAAAARRRRRRSGGRQARRAARSRGRRGRAAAARASRAGAVPGPGARRFTVSTTTALERPCEKLWRTVLCSTGRFSVSVLGDMCSVLSPGVFFVSLIQLTVLRVRGRRSARPREAGLRRVGSAVGAKPAPTREKAVAPGARDEGRMYHMRPAQCQIQFVAGKIVDDGNGGYRIAGAFSQRPGELSPPVRRRFRGHG